MELRSARKKNEYNELKITLNGMGFYEEGMELQEMRQIIDALKMSASEMDASLPDMDMERAIRESEMDFMPLNDERVFNSTMHMSHSPCTSPEVPSQHIVVHVDVHHSLDWSPTHAEEHRLRRKRVASSPKQDENNSSLHSIRNYEETEPHAKRHEKSMDVITTQSQSLSLSSIDLNNNVINDCPTDLSSTHSTIDENDFGSHEIIGPVSMRRPPNDSGVNSGNEGTISTPPSASTSLELPSSSSLSTSSIPFSNNSSQNTSVIEIFGPVSLRRPAHDSGVASFNESPNLSSSSWDFYVSSRELSNIINSNSSLNFVNNISSLENHREESNNSGSSLVPPIVVENTSQNPVLIKSEEEEYESSDPSL